MVVYVCGVHRVAVAAGAGVQADVGSLVGGEAVEDSAVCVSDICLVRWWLLGVGGSLRVLVDEEDEAFEEVGVCPGVLGVVLESEAAWLKHTNPSETRLWMKEG